jgi:hypothetical protein
MAINSSDKVWEKLYKEMLNDFDLTLKKNMSSIKKLDEELMVKEKEEKRKNTINELEELSKEELIKRIIETLDKLDGSYINDEGCIFDADYNVYYLEDLEEILRGDKDV